MVAHIATPSRTNLTNFLKSLKGEKAPDSLRSHLAASGRKKHPLSMSNQTTPGRLDVRRRNLTVFICTRHAHDMDSIGDESRENYYTLCNDQ